MFSADDQNNNNGNSNALHLSSSLRHSSSSSIADSSVTAMTADNRASVAEWEVLNLQRLFNVFDSQRTGYLLFDEVLDLLRATGITGMTLNQLRKYDHILDPLNQGVVEFPDLVEFYIYQSRELTKYRALSPAEEKFHIDNFETNRFVPTSKKKIFWDFAILVITLYYAVRINYEWYRCAPLNDTTVGFEILLTVILMLDLGVQANTVYFDTQGKLIDNLETIATNYFFSWFGPDFLSAFPFDLCILAAFPDSYCTMTAFLVLRTLRVLRFMRIFYSLFENLNTNVPGLMSPTYIFFVYRTMPTIKAIVFLILFFHILTCGWLQVSEYAGDNPISGAEAIDNKTVSYIDSLYYVVYTLSTVGYGDISPATEPQRIYTIFLNLCALLFNGLVISQISVFLTQADISSFRRDRMSETLAVLKYFGVNFNLQSEILSFQNYLLEHNLSDQHRELYSGLPAPMQEKVVLAMRLKLINLVPVFHPCHIDVKLALANSLVNSVFCPQQYIIVAGEVGSQMFFLGHGVADVVAPDGNFLATLRKGNFFGEMAIFVESALRTASVKALTYCDVFSLRREDFLSLIAKFRTLRESIEEQMKERIREYRSKSNVRQIVKPRSERPGGNKKVVLKRRNSFSSSGIPFDQNKLREDDFEMFRGNILPNVVSSSDDDDEQNTSNNAFSSSARTDKPPSSTSAKVDMYSGFDYNEEEDPERPPNNNNNEPISGNDNSNEEEQAAPVSNALLSEADIAKFGKALDRTNKFQHALKARARKARMRVAEAERKKRENEEEQERRRQEQPPAPKRQSTFCLDYGDDDKSVNLATTQEQWTDLLSRAELKHSDTTAQEEKEEEAQQQPDADENKNNDNNNNFLSFLRATLFPSSGAAVNEATPSSSTPSSSQKQQRLNKSPPLPMRLPQAVREQQQQAQLQQHNEENPQQRQLQTSVSRRDHHQNTTPNLEPTPPSSPERLRQSSQASSSFVSSISQQQHRHHHHQNQQQQQQFLAPNTTTSTSSYGPSPLASVSSSVAAPQGFQPIVSPNDFGYSVSHVFAPAGAAPASPFPGTGNTSSTTPQSQSHQPRMTTMSLEDTVRMLRAQTDREKKEREGEEKRKKKLEMMLASGGVHVEPGRDGSITPFGGSSIRSGEGSMPIANIPRQQQQQQQQPLPQQRHESSSASREREDNNKNDNNNDDDDDDDDENEQEMTELNLEHTTSDKNKKKKKKNKK